MGDQLTAIDKNELTLSEVKERVRRLESFYAVQERTIADTQALVQVIEQKLAAKIKTLEEALAYAELNIRNLTSDLAEQRRSSERLEAEVRRLRTTLYATSPTEGTARLDPDEPYEHEWPERTLPLR